MLACHAGGPGSIPGRCILFIFHFVSLTFVEEGRILTNKFVTPKVGNMHVAKARVDNRD